MTSNTLHNPHLEGAPFFWKAGPIGVLLVHGLTATPVEVRLLAERLYAQNYTVAGSLLAGHGTTPKQLNQTTRQGWIWSVEQVYHEMATVCDVVFVGGESTGTVIALHLASKYGDIAGVLNYAPAIKLALQSADAFKMYALAPFILGVPKSSLDSSENWQGYKLNPLKAGIELLRLGNEVTAHLPLIHQPVLVVQGALDTTIHPDSGKIICEGVSSAVTELHWMEKSSHVVLLDQELDEITAVTINFMQKCLAAENAD